MEFTKATFIAQLAADRTTLVEQLDQLDNVLIGQAYVVRCQGLTLGFDFDATRTVTGTRTVPLTKAPRFTRRDAETLAQAVRNGNNQPGEAVHIVVALRNAITEVDRLLAALDI